MMHKVVTFGEIMLRLATPGYKRFIQSDNLGATFGGGEANVACLLYTSPSPRDFGLSRMP
ncbi:MAG: sugar kinase, partial [Proteiniphilum sp.]|nr:sugar kinase [Proteiniphilum sp.]